MKPANLELLRARVAAVDLATKKVAYLAANKYGSVDQRMRSSGRRGPGTLGGWRGRGGSVADTPAARGAQIAEQVKNYRFGNEVIKRLSQSPTNLEENKKKIQQEISEIQGQVKKYLSRPRITHEESLLVNRHQVLTNQLAEHERLAIERYKGALGPSSGRIYTLYDTVPTEIRRGVRGEFEFAAHLMGNGSLEIPMKTSNSRSRWSPPMALRERGERNPPIHGRIVTDGFPGATVHELGHAIEYARGGSNAAYAFRVYRTKTDGDGFPLNIISDNYPRHEMGHDDNFAKAVRAVGGGDWSEKEVRLRAAYAGKLYRTNDDNRETYATEIISTGIELMHKNAPAFAAADPEWFKFTLGVVRGDIK